MAVTPIRSLSYGSWRELKRDLLNELFEDGVFRSERYLFRGMGSADWKLAPAFDRRFGYLEPDERLRVWDELIEQWRRGCAEHGHLREAAGGEVTRNEVALWALGQHHGLPTRLLDWSTSPYIAAFFAFKECLERLPHRYSHVALWILHLDNPVWAKDQGVEIVSAPALENVRLKNQSGKFTLSHTQYASLEEYVTETGSGVALTKVVLPASEAVPALPDLDSMGINSYRVYPDLGGLAEMATMRLLLSELTAQGR
jgi:FRG domain-containing protein